MANLFKQPAFYFIVCVLATILFAVLHGQNYYGYDWAHYHYYNGYAFWNQRWSYDFRPAGFHSYLNPLFDAIKFKLSTKLPYAAATLIIAAWQGLAYGLAWLIGALILEKTQLKHWRWWLLAFTLLGLYTPAISRQISGFNNDLDNSVFMLLGIFLWLKTYTKETGGNPNKLLCIAGWFIGISVGLKLTMAPIALAWLVITLLFKPKNISRINLLFCVAISSGLGFLLTNGWWMWHLWNANGSPFFPAFNQIFKAPGWGHVSAFDISFTVQHWWELLYYPVLGLIEFNRVSPDDFFSLLYPIIYFGLIYCGLRWIIKHIRGNQQQTVTQHEQNIVFRRLLIFCMLAYVLSMQFFSIYRYLCPITLLTPAIILYGIHVLTPKEIKKYIFIGVWMLILTSTRLEISSFSPIWSSDRPLYINKSIKFDWQKKTATLASSAQKNQHALVLSLYGQIFNNLIPSLPAGWKFVNITPATRISEYIMPTNYPPTHQQVIRFIKWATKNDYPIYLLTYKKLPDILIPNTIKPGIMLMQKISKATLQKYHLAIGKKCISIKVKIAWYPLSLYYQFKQPILCQLQYTAK